MLHHPWLVLFFLLVCWFPPCVQASDRVHGVRVFLNNGDPDQAILTSKSLLSGKGVDESERYDLLSLIAYAEEMKAQAKHYEDVSAAIEALKTLQKEFPQRVRGAPLLWRMVWLHWKHGDDKEALQEARTLRSNYADSTEAQQAAMLMARIYIQERKFNEARSNLMRYGLSAQKNSREDALTQAWIAVVDAEENRYQEAVKAMDWVYRHFPDVIKSDELVFSVYIQSLHTVGRDQDALAKAELFLKNFLDGDAVVPIRLLRADLWALLGKEPRSRIEREYTVLAEQQAEYSIGKQAFMRKLMLMNQDSRSYHDLKPVIIALKRLASRNQLSPVENEALLDLGRLWYRLSQSDPEHAPKQAMIAALDSLSRVMGSDIIDFRDEAKSMGVKLFDEQLKQHLEASAWEKAVALWERYPQFRSTQGEAKQRAFAVAHGLRMLMEYPQAESLLETLYADADGSVWGQKVMLERARLWMDRRDRNGIDRILKWLDNHEYTLYRPEMLLLVAQMQLQAGEEAVAAQTMATISVDDVAPEERAVYWKSDAEIHEGLKHWRAAADSWRAYGQSVGAVPELALIHEADALFKAESYKQASALYVQVEKEKQDAAWRYHYFMCQLKVGDVETALVELESLSQEKNAGVYASLAALELADRKAVQLLKDYR